MMKRSQLAALAVAALTACLISAGCGPAASTKESRLSEIIDANINATHAFQVLMHQSSKKGDAAVWSDQGVSDADLKAMVEHQKALLAEDPKVVKAWVEGGASSFDPSKDLEPILQHRFQFADNLPLNVLAESFETKTKATHQDVMAVSSLLQMMLDIERDADVLQQMYGFYVGLGLPVHTTRLGLSARTDQDFLELGNELSPQMASSPFDTDPATLQMLFRKMWNWGRRYTGERDKSTLANELLAEPDIAPLIPKIEAMPAQKIAVIGHSFTMNVHWASPSSFVPIVTEMIRKHNPKVEIRQWEAGGLTAGRAYKNFYQDALAWKPDKVLFVVISRNDEDFARLEEMFKGFAAAGTQVLVFDNVKDPTDDPAKIKRANEIAEKTGAKVIEVVQLLDQAPDRDKFRALDGIHMTEPYHRLMAKEWLKFLVGARQAKL